MIRQIRIQIMLQTLEDSFLYRKRPNNEWCPDCRGHTTTF